MVAPSPSEGGSTEEPLDEELLEEQKDGTGPCIAVEVTARGAPVPGAHVKAVRQKAYDIIELHPIIVGADGRGQGWCKPGEYVFAAQAPGFAPEVKGLVVKESDTAPRVQFSLKPGKSLRGHVQDADSREPVAGAQLVFSLDEDSHVVDEVTAVSDARGDFQVGDLGEGSYTIIARAPGHAMTMDGAEVPASGPVIISMRGTARLEGQVVDGRGAPVAGATVEASPQEAVMQELKPTQTDARGFFSLELPEGIYILAARAAGQSAIHRGAVTLTRGALVDGLVIQLQPAGILSGKVFVRSSQKPIRGADVRIRDTESEFSEHFQTDARGGFRAELPPGRYGLSVSRDGYPSFDRDGLRIQAGQELALEVPLVQACSVVGSVKDGAGHPVEEAEITLRRFTHEAGEREGSADELAHESTDEEGNYSAIELEAGRYRIEARLARGGSPVVREITLAEGEEARVDFVIPQLLGEVKGIVQHVGGGPLLQQVDVSVSSKGDELDVNAPWVEPDETGHFTVKLLPGRYTFKARYLDFEKSGPAQSVTVEGGKVSLVRLTVSGALVETSGVVVDSRGAPAPEAAVALSGEDVHTSGEADAQGRFVLTTPSTSEGTLAVIQARRQAEDGEARDVRVGSRGVVVRLEAEAALRGRVIPTRGAAVQGFELYAERERGSRSLFDRGDSRPFAGDSFELLDVPAGLVELRVRTSDGRSGKAQARLEPGRTASVEIPVGELCRVVGRVVGPASGTVRLDEGKPGVRRETLKQEGRFEFFAVEPGAHVLWLGHKKLPFTLQQGETLDLGVLEEL